MTRFLLAALLLAAAGCGGEDKPDPIVPLPSGTVITDCACSPVEHPSSVDAPICAAGTASYRVCVGPTPPCAEVVCD